MKIKNQKPDVLMAACLPSAQGNLNHEEWIKESLINPLLKPIPSKTIMIHKDNGSSLDEEELLSLFIDCQQEDVRIESEKECSSFLSQTMLYFDASYSCHVNSIFINQAAAKEKMLWPTPMVRYSTQADVIPSAKQLLKDASKENLFFASLALTYKPDTLGFWFLQDSDFKDFQQFLKQRTASMTLSIQCSTLFNQFISMKSTDAFEAMWLRKDPTQHLEENSFARLLPALAQEYCQSHPGKAGILPFNTKEMFCPLSICFINVERHARAMPTALHKDWSLFQDSLKAPVKVVSDKALSRINTIQRNADRAKSKVCAARSAVNNPLTQAKRDQQFSQDKICARYFVKALTKILDKMKKVAFSQNAVRTKKPTFSRCSRRNPDNYNLPGSAFSHRYKPDIHLYIDTSGSITVKNYEMAVKLAVHIAKKLNVNLYYNAFTHQMGQCHELRIKGRSEKEILQEFMRTPKPCGGTDFEQVWNYINQSEKRRSELSVMITDFGYTAPNAYVKHPKNLFYLPCDQMSFDSIKKMAQSFVYSCRTIDHNIRQRILF